MVRATMRGCRQRFRIELLTSIFAPCPMESSNLSNVLIVLDFRKPP